MSNGDSWSPKQYERFAEERSRPFYDLLDLVEARGPERVLDLGCGTGALTAEMHDRLGARETIGIDHSNAMLAETAAVTSDRLTFSDGDIADPPVTGLFNLVLANASLQWVPDHPTVLAHWTQLVADEGELAVQVPANVDHPSHRVIAALATEPPWLDAGDGPPPPDPVHSVLRPEEYAELLFELGYPEPHVRLQVYGHVMESSEAVVEWTKGTTLTRMKRHFAPDVYDAFVAEYRRRLVVELGDRRPYFYAFKRILIHARR